jgi:hypothetical protein
MGPVAIQGGQEGGVVAWTEPARDILEDDVKTYRPDLGSDKDIQQCSPLGSQKYPRYLCQLRCGESTLIQDDYCDGGVWVGSEGTGEAGTGPEGEVIEKTIYGPALGNSRREQTAGKATGRDKRSSP